jgi:hypothetical protein
LNWLTTTLIFSKMPIEIKELIVKITVADQPQSSSTETNRQEAKDVIITACVEQVLEILSKKQER